MYYEITKNRRFLYKSLKGLYKKLIPYLYAEVTKRVTESSASCDEKTVSIDNDFGFREFVVDQPQYGWDIELLRKHGYTIKDLILTDEVK